MRQGININLYFINGTSTGQSSVLYQTGRVSFIKYLEIHLKRFRKGLI